MICNICQVCVAAEDVKHSDDPKTTENKGKKDHPKLSEDEKKHLQEVWNSMTPEEQQNCITESEERQKLTPEQKEELRKTRKDTSKSDKSDKKKACRFHMHEERHKNGENGRH